MPPLNRSIALAATAGLISTALITSPAHAATSVSALSAGLTPIHLLNINDFHGRIDGSTGVNLACAIETQKATLGEGATAFLSAGDNIGASTFTSAAGQDTPTIDYLNALQLRASAVGNHEFDRGFADLRDRVIPRATFTYLGANVYQRGTTTAALPEYLVTSANGVRVGVIGAVTQETPTLVSPLGVAGLDFGNPVDAVNRVAAQLTDGNDANGEADVLVAEYHDGAVSGTTLASGLASSSTFADIVNRTSAKVSVIFNGHTHQAYLWEGNGRSVSQSASYGALLGVVSLGYDPATKTVTEFASKQVAPTAPTAACATDPQFMAAKSVINAAVAASADLGKQVIGKVSADVTRAFANGDWSTGKFVGAAVKANEDRSRESVLSNLQAEIWLQSMNAPGRLGADVGVQNPGGVRTDLLYAPSGTEQPGEVTYAEAATVSPFANNLVTVALTGAQFKQALEQQWRPDGASVLWLGLSKNVTFTFDKRRDVGSKITSITVNGATLKPTDIVRVATNSFLGAGGDSFVAFRSAPAADSGLVDLDAFVTWLKNAGTVTPTFAKQGVEVEDAPAVINYGKTYSFTVQGWDMTSLGSLQNKIARLSIETGGRGSYPVTITSVRIPGVPNLDGKAVVSFKLTGKYLPDDTARPVVLKLVADQTGTTVRIPTMLKG